MTFTHIRTPLNKYTFKLKKIRDWVESNCDGSVLNLFAGKTLLCVNEVRVDVRQNMVADYHMDALEFTKQCKKKFDTILLDPPYAYRKSMEMYEGAISSPFNALKNLLPAILEVRGKIITFGYHSVSMGSKRGFEVEAICIFSHGGAIHDTIATIEIFRGKKSQKKLKGDL